MKDSISTLRLDVIKYKEITENNQPDSFAEAAGRCLERFMEDNRARGVCGTRYRIRINDPDSNEFTEVTMSFRRSKIIWEFDGSLNECIKEIESEL